MAEDALNKQNQHKSPPLVPVPPQREDGGIIFYGLPYCDATKLAMEWFNERHIPFTLHDYKTRGINAQTLKAWCGQKGWQVLLNKRSTTWRSLDAATQESVTSEDAAIALMQKNTSLIKRPVIVKDGIVLAVGVDKKLYGQVF